MKKSAILLILFTFIIALTALMPTNINYDKLWKKVETYQKNGRPKSALKVVDEIFKIAKIEQNNPQELKALIYKVSLKSTFEEDYLLQSATRFEKLIPTAEMPQKQIISSLAAQLYQAWFSQNRYKILQRKQLAQSDDDPQTWDAFQFTNKIKTLYLNSLQPEDSLAGISLDKYKAILKLADSTSIRYSPTLYDLLAMRAVHYFSENDYHTFDFEQTSSTLADSLLVPAMEFVNVNINPNNTDDEVLVIYQHLLKQHLNDTLPFVLVDLDLKRIAFIKNQYRVKTEEVRALLQKLYKKYQSYDVSVRIAWRLAENYKTGETEPQLKTGSVSGSDSSLIIARNVCSEAVRLHPNAPFVNNCKNLIASIEQPALSIKAEKQQLPEIPVLVKVDFKNLSRIYYKIVRVNTQEVMLDVNKSLSEWIKSDKYLSAPGRGIKEVVLPETTDFMPHSTEIKMEGLPLGSYFVYVSADKNFSTSKLLGSSFVNVTGLSYVTKPAENQTQFIVLNRKTGATEEGVAGTVFYGKYRRGNYRLIKSGTFVTDKNGFAAFAGDVGYGYHYIVQLTNNSDTLYQSDNLYRYGNAPSRPAVRVHLFTDRSIYRPGQTVYFKGIVVEHTGNKYSVLKDYKTKVSFKNANYKEVASLDVSTNDFGSFSGSFVIPTGMLNGNWRLQTSKGSVSVSVEEYKRPTFLVTFDTLTGAYKYNDAVTVTGKVEYFNGSPVSGAKVSYRVTRQNYLPMPCFWYRPNISQETDLTNGLLKTDENGKFSVTFKAVPDDILKAAQFSVYADVTDITGEVHSGTTAIKISNRQLWVSLDVSDEVDMANHPTLKIAATNTAGKPLPVSGELKIYALHQPNRIFIKRLWSEPDIYLMSREEYKASFPQIAYQGEANPENWNKQLVQSKKLFWKGDTTLSAPLFQSLKPGYYKFVFKADGQSGIPLSDSAISLLYSSKSKKSVAGKQFWATLSKTTAEPGETVNLTVSSSEKRTRIHYELTVKDTLVESRWIKLNKKQLTIPIAIKESWRGGIKINLFSIKNNRRYALDKNINVPFSNKKLNIQLQTRRNHLTPGNKETWRIKISGYKGDKVAAELLAAMYDESLDQIKSHRWNFDLFHQYHYGNSWSARQFPVAGYTRIASPKRDFLKEFVIQPPEVNWFGAQFNNDDNILYSIAGQVRGVSAVRMVKTGVVDDEMDMEQEEAQTSSNQEINPTPAPLPKATGDDQPVVLRTDFRETAFFYPQLHTDSTGSVVFSFTTPDALTQWKLMMLAHTSDLSSDIKTLSFKAYKELMVMPNVPRFVRQGDKLMFSARVTNFSKKAQKVRVNLFFTDPLTGKKINPFVSRIATGKSLQLQAGESAKVSWQIAIPDDINLLAYRIEAASESFSDGEERVIPVLTNRVLVTETMPMYVNAHAHKKYEFSRLVNQGKKASLSTLNNFRYTLEFTSNPAWYAIQALPYMSNPVNESASSLFRAWFANALSGWIVNNHPRIKTVIESWKHNSPDAFLSALQKNEELKNTVLEETPWVLEAENESEQKQRIALLFDLNNLNNRQNYTLNKLQQLQRGSGAWPWFNGMHDDRYVTQQIVLGMAKLIDKGVITFETPGVKTMLSKAVSYLDRTIKKDYDALKKQPKVKLSDKHIGSLQIQYLYARALLNNAYPLKKQNQKAYNYYLGQAKKYWLKENNYLQAMIAVVLFENGNRNEAEAILRSLEERSLYSDELGMYWRSNRSWYWYQAPVETQAMIIEAFSRMNYNPQNIDKMKIWLLKQKQTERWATSSATAEAVYALLMTGKSTLLSETKPVSFNMGGKPLVIDSEKQEAGTGYFKKSWSGSEVKYSMGDIEVNNPNNHITWGAAYWQYFEDIDKVTASKSPLYVEKKLYVETLTGHGPVLEAATGKNLKTGDKIVVRLVIRTDRDMDFVQLKDVRATGMEVTNQRSGYQYGNGLSYYLNNKDASTNYFFRRLNKGTYVLEYPVFLTQQGVFPVGLATIQCLYAPEFAAHSQGGRIVVGE